MDSPAPIELMQSGRYVPNGLLLVGEPYWIETRHLQGRTGRYGFGVGRLHLTRAAPWTASRRPAPDLVEVVHADADSWDRDQAAQWRTISDWLATNPDDPEHAAMADFLERNRRAHLAYQRRYLGWGVFVTRVSS